MITTVAGGGAAPVLLPRSAGTISTTGGMSAARMGATATLLDNGKVLVAGGYVGLEPTGSAELYDPSTGMFSPTGSMNAALAPNLATLLPDGRVLFVGTTSPNRFNVPVTTQIYNATTGTFTAAGTPLTISRPVTATLLNNGKVLITGGVGAMPGALSNYAAELFDPLTGQFAAAANMSRAHTFAVATLLPDGKVFLAEGVCASSGPSVRGNGLYDPATDRFSPMADTQSCLSVGPPSILLANGRVLLGGTVFDVSSGTFTPGPEIVQWGYTPALLADGTVLIAGGQPQVDYNTCEICEARSTPDLYLRDPVTGTLGLAGFMSVTRYGAATTYLPDGTVLLSGGAAAYLDSPDPARVEIYTPPVLTAAPVLFALTGDGTGQGAVWHASGRIASSENPAVAGEILSMNTTGLIRGGAIPPRVIVGGRLAEVLYFGDAPGYPGYFQVNFRVPAGVTGPAVPVRLRYLDRPSNILTIPVQ